MPWSTDAMVAAARESEREKATAEIAQLQGKINQAYSLTENLLAILNNRPVPICVACGKPAVGTCEKTEGFHRTAEVAQPRSQHNHVYHGPRGECLGCGLTETQVAATAGAGTYEEGEDSGYADWMMALKEEYDVDFEGPQDFIKWAKKNLTTASAKFPHGVLLVNATIEECACVADEYSAWPAREIAATIRAKKK